MPGKKESKRSFARNSSVLSLLTLVSRVLGLVREMTRAAFLGTGMLADSFTIAFMIPNFMRRLFAEGSVTVAFIPTFKGYLLGDDTRKTREFLSATFTVLVLLVSGTVVAGIAAAPLIVSLFGSDPVETAVLTRIMFPFLALVSVAAFLQGILNGVDEFTVSGIAPILFNLCFIFVPMAISPWSDNPARAMAVGVLAGGTAQAVCQLPSVLRRGFAFGFMDPRRAFANPGMRRVLVLVGPTLLGMAAYQLNNLACTSIASYAGRGVASSLEYSLRLQELMLGIFAVSIGTVLLPELSSCFARKAMGEFGEKLGRAMDAIALITIPVSVFAAITAKDLVALVYKIREFGGNSVDLTSQAFFWHIVGLYFIALNRVVAPAFYARLDSKSPTWAGLASFAVNIPLAFGLSLVMKGAGIALALSISSLVNTAILLVLLVRSKDGNFGEIAGRSVVYALKMGVFSIIAGAPCLFAVKAVRTMFSESGNRFVSSGLPVLSGGLVFAFLGIACLAVTRDTNAAALVAMFSRKGRKGRGD